MQAQCHTEQESCFLGFLDTHMKRQMQVPRRGSTIEWLCFYPFSFRGLASTVTMCGNVFNHFVAGEKAAMHSIPPVTQASPGVIQIWPLRGEEIGWNIAYHVDHKISLTINQTFRAFLVPWCFGGRKEFYLSINCIGIV